MESHLASPITNSLGQVKIASLSKTRKWVWVNTKQFRCILKRRAARLKWEETRRTQFQRKTNKQTNKSLWQRGGSNRGKSNTGPALYSPTSTPLTWSSDLYVQELLNIKRRVEVLEVKEHERDLKIHLLAVENQRLPECNKVLNGQVTLLQEAILVGKNEWQDMNADWQRMKE